MATNPYVNKVVIDSQTKLDLTGDTVAPADVRAGVTFHDLTGAPQVGTAVGGKTVASVAPASVVVGYTNVVATYETVCYDTTTFDTVTVREYEVSFGSGIQVDALDPEYFGMDLVQADRLNAQMTSADPRLYGVAPGSYVGTQGTLKSTTTKSGSAADTSAWLAGFRAFYGGSVNAYPAKTNPSQSVYALTGTSQNWPIAIDVDDEFTVTVTRMDGTTQTITPNDPSDVDVDYNANGNEALVRAQCKSVTGTAVYGPGYLVTYTDNTTETFAAASGDIADGSY